MEKKWSKRNGKERKGEKKSCKVLDTFAFFRPIETFQKEQFNITTVVELLTGHVSKSRPSSPEKHVCWSAAA